MAANNNKKGGMLLSLGGFIIFTGDQICLDINVFHYSAVVSTWNIWMQIE